MNWIVFLPSGPWKFSVLYRISVIRRFRFYRFYCIVNKNKQPNRNVIFLFFWFPNAMNVFKVLWNELTLITSSILERMQIKNTLTTKFAVCGFKNSFKIKHKCKYRYRDVQKFCISFNNLNIKEFGFGFVTTNN